MSRKSAIYGIAAVLALAACARAQDASAPPRYATQIPPSQDQVLDHAPPVAAPTTPVTTASGPAATAFVPPTDNVSQIQRDSQPRYATMIQQQEPETVTVTGLRPSESDGYRLGTGDTVRVTVFGETDLSGTFEIDSQGYVRLPLIGQIAAAGLSTYGLESRITDSLISGKYLLNPRVNVEVTTYRPFYIVGEISKPGEYPYVNAMTTQNAIALAGGFTDRAVESSVFIRHQGEMKEHEVDLDQGTRIRPGDVIRVERSTYWTIMTVLSPLISPFSSIAYLLK
jgi:polysaccharide export outer membrane protein